VDKSNERSAVEKANVLQIRYALMLDTEIEEVKNLEVYTFVDDWYGTRYRLGGSTKSGIDCSAFTQIFFTSLYGITIPRTAREQYSKATKVSRTHLKMGDLVFFNTRGGVSHVGIYLQNNKFVHASTSEGVMISDLYDNYWLRKFIGAGRMSAELASQ
jgi:lipoprotein Spr